MPSIRKCVCGREYQITSRKLKEPDLESLYCECGHELLRWNGFYTYAVLLIKDIAAGK